jgi:ubiquinone/menaquinone biosynthesis C-methylase UbiE
VKENVMLRYLWKRALLHRIEFKDQRNRLDWLYTVEDPWGMSGEGEQHRFAATNDIIQEMLPGLTNLLEIGCGEGHQTEYFSRIAKKVYGVDVSQTAVKRAQARCPKAAFTVTDISTSPLPPQWPRFDVVVACEVIYYMSDIAAAIAAMERAGKTVLLTYYDHYEDKLSPLIALKANAEYRKISYRDLSWTVAFWETPASVTPD